MFNNNFIIGVFFVFSFFACKKEEPDFSKGFIKYFGGIGVDKASDVQQTSDGGYIVIGTTNSVGNGGSDVYIVKTDSKGNQEWRRTFGGNLNDNGSSLHLTNDNGYVFIGTYRQSLPGLDSNKTDIYVLKMNSVGDTLWTTKYGFMGFNEEGIAIKQTNDGGYIVAGNTDAQNNGDMIFYKISSTGAYQSHTTQPQTGNTAGIDDVINLFQLADGSYVVNSKAKNSDVKSRLFQLPNTITAPAYNTILDENIDESIDVQAEAAMTNDGHYVITGTTTDNNVYLAKVKFSISGFLTWFKVFGGAGNDVGSSVQSTPDGGYILLGTTTSKGAGSSDIYLLKTDGEGNVQWEKTFGGAGLDIGAVVRNTSDGGYIILGTVEFGDDPSNIDNIMSLIKVNANGEVHN